MGLWTGHIHGSFDFYMVVHYVYGHGLYWLAKGIHLSRYNSWLQISLEY
jgi:hypothetical protein